MAPPQATSVGTLQLLGTARVRDLPAGIDAVERQRKRFALLAYLAAAGEGHDVHSRDTLQALFWPELDQARARNALAQALHFLRQQLGGDVVLAQGRTSVAIARDRLRCDVADLKRAAREGRRADSVECYTGPLLPGFHVEDAPGFERWLEEERARLALLASASAAALADAAADTGDSAAAIRWARRAFEIVPDDEPAFRRLLTLLDRAGDRAGAVALETAFRQRLAVEYGLEPSAESEALARTIRLRRLARTPGGAAAPSSVAVLPFRDMSSAHTDVYLGDGMAEELIAILAGIEGLHVVSRTSTFAYRDSTLPLRQIAGELGVETVVEGSVRRAGDRVRITAQLIDARSDAHMWAESYDRAFTDIVDVQCDVAQRIATALRSRLTPEHGQRAAARAAHHPDAYQHYLRARHLCTAGSVESWERGIAAFHEALTVDPDYAMAWAGLANAYMQPALFTIRPPVSRQESKLQARTAALRALELAPDLAEAHATLSVVQWYDWDWAASDVSLQRAITLQPGYAEAHHRHGLFLACRGRFAEADAALLHAQHLDPLSLAIFISRGIAAMRARRFDEAIALLTRAREIDPRSHAALHYLIEACVYGGRYGDGIELQKERIDLAPEDVARVRAAYALHGRPGADRAQFELLEKVRASKAVRACLMTRIGDMDHAFGLLEQAFEERDPVLADGIRVHPGFDLFRGDPRFHRVVERMKIPASEVVRV